MILLNYLKIEIDTNLNLISSEYKNNYETQTMNNAAKSF